MKTTIILDMYGVIIKESKGCLIPYTLGYMPKSEHSEIINSIRHKKLIARAALGDLTSDELFLELGFDDPRMHMRDYIENHLTFDRAFLPFAEEYKDRYRFALLSNDVSEWSEYIVGYHGLAPFFSARIVSGDVHCRKPDPQIFRIALEQLNVNGVECIFVDNKVANLEVATRLGILPILFNVDGEQFDGPTVNSFDELRLWLRAFDLRENCGS